MKTLKFFIFAVVTIFLAACSGGNGGNGGNSMTLTPTSEKIQGPLGDYFEVVSRDYKAKDHQVSIEFKRVKDGFPSPWEEGMEVGFTDGRFEPQFTAEFQDGDGDVVSKDQTDIVWEEDELIAIADLRVGETATIKFDCSEDAVQFKMGSTFKVHEKEENSSSSDMTSSDDEDDSNLPQVEVILPASLKGYVEIVSADKSMDSNGYPQMDITFKLLKQKATNSLCSSSGQMWIVGHAQNANGANINDLNPKNITSREWRTEDSDGSMFKEFLEGDPDETISLQFTGENNIELFEKDQSKIASGKAKTKKALEELAKFRLSITN